MNIVILLFDRVTALDAIGPYEVLSRIPGAKIRFVAKEAGPIRSDNGSPFASHNGPLGLSRLSAWWVGLGIDLDRIDPGHPEQNGGHERMHLDMRNELQGQVTGGIREHQAAFDIWVRTFNQVRPHEALDMKTPAEIYESSPRKYEECCLDLEYPSSFLPRRIGSNGCIILKGVKYFLSSALDG